MIKTMMRYQTVSAVVALVTGLSLSLVQGKIVSIQEGRSRGAHFR